MLLEFPCLEEKYSRKYSINYNSEYYQKLYSKTEEIPMKSEQILWK